MKKKVAIHNLGCKVNAYETEALKGMFLDAGDEIVPFTENADVYIINTCCVTAIAEKKSRQMIHKARKQNPDAVIAAIGCYPEVSAPELLQDGTADIIVGSGDKMKLPAILASGVRGIITGLPDEERYQGYFSMTGREHTRGFIKIEDGCDNFCSYCIIPYARGRVHSRSAEDIRAEVQALAADGCREIVLSGINISSYGRDFERKRIRDTQTDCRTMAGDAAALSGLIRTVSEIDGIERIRLGSLEPVLITPEFLETICGIGKVCPHFHLSLQSGCAGTLLAMNRHYTPEEYFAKVGLLRQFYHEPSITTDIIAGFPGETEENFRETKEFVRSVRFFSTHVFPYSLRKGTKAALMENQVPIEIRKARAAELIRINEEIHRSWLKKRIGSVVQVLFEEEEIVKGKRMISGHTERYEKVMIEASETDWLNSIREVHLTGILTDRSENNALTGKLA